jgi:ketosteroid isomerase-like protein
MANPNVALVQEALIAYQAGDLDRLRELFDPEIEIVGDSLFGWLYEIRDGRATRFHVYVTIDEALQVANGLVETAQ